MARVNRFIFNSDFMTIARLNRQSFTVTIPAGETVAGFYSGEKEIDIDIPSGCWTRCKVKYTSTYTTTETACEGVFLIEASKSGKTIDYICSLEFSEGKLKLGYIVFNKTDTTTVLADAQTVTITLDIMQQPNS